MSSNDDNTQQQHRPPPPPAQDFEITVAHKLDALSQNLLQTFLRLDVDRDGYVTRSDLKTALHNVLGIDLTPLEMDALFVRFAYFEDNAKTQHGIRYPEFVKYMDETAKQRLSSAATSSASGTVVQTEDSNSGSHSNSNRFSMMPILLDPGIERTRKRLDLLKLLHSHETPSHHKNHPTTALFLEMDTHRSGRITPQEFCDWVNSKIGNDNNLWTPTLLEELLGPEHYKPDNGGGMTQSDFVKMIVDLEQDNSKQLGLHHPVTTTPGNTQKDDSSSLSLSLAREHYQEVLVACVDDAKTDVELIREVANQLFCKRVKLLDAFSKYDVDRSGTLSALELCHALDQAAGLCVSIDRAQSLVDKFDLDGDGRLNKGEFVKLIASSSLTAQEESEKKTSSLAHQQQQQENPEVLRRSLVKAVVGHEEQEQHLEICNRLDNEDIKLLLDFREAVQDEHMVASKIFQRMDTDNSKSITEDQLKDGFEKMGVEISPEHIHHIMTRFGTEGTGKMKYHQFVKLLSANL